MNKDKVMKEYYFGFDDRRQATNFIESFNDIIDKYGCATLADAYDAYGQPTSYLDTKIGWIEKDIGKIVRVIGGNYVVVLPEAIKLG